MICDLRDIPCPMCGGSQRTSMGAPGKFNQTYAASQPQLSQVRTVRCLDCSGMYVSPMVYYSDSLRSALYNIKYFDGDAKNMGEKRANLRLLARCFGGNLSGKSLLDIGCGTGEHLRTAASMGMSVTGIDVDKTIADYVHTRYGFKMVCGPLLPETFPPQSFDVVVLWHVIEHLQRPADILRTIHTILKPDGLFLLGTPNADSFMEDIHNAYTRIRHGRGKNSTLTPFTEPYHILGFNLRSATSLLRICGFRPIFARLRSGLEWKDTKHPMAMKVIKVAGACLNRGTGIAIVARRDAV